MSEHLELRLGPRFSEIHRRRESVRIELVDSVEHDTLERTWSRVWAVPPMEGADRVLALWEGGCSSADLPKDRPLVIGRSRSSTLRIDHPSVSREHAHLLFQNGMVYLVDLGSSNGTRLSGRRVPAQAPTPVRPGDLIQMGSAVVVVQSSQPEDSEYTQPGETPALSEMQQLELLTQRIASSNISVVLLGETGVGKEVMAARIHGLSPRAGRPLVRLNCAALNETLLESELFGHEKGAFTGAVATKLGMLESADGGTVFFDEVGEMPMAIQAKLLRVLETREVTRVGSIRPRTIDVRFIAATNRQLDEAIGAGTFRRDLYFRLAGMTLTIPPLRERRAEIAELAELFAREVGQASQRNLTLSQSAIDRLERHSWPGNVRELRNVIERAAVLCHGRVIEPEHLVIDRVSASIAPPPPPALAEAPMPAPSERAGPDPVDSFDLRSDLERHERERIILALEEAGGNQTRAAKLLGISRRTLVSRLDQYKLPRPRKGS